MSNSRQEKERFNRNLLILVIVTLVVGGSSLIALIYGPATLLTSLPCLLGGAALILIPYGILTGLEKWSRRLDEE